jgi:BirA family transcriptional regulator, biotin operon repressor / biotin---[acetyl-CoA-carboxylase] ligase
VTGFLARQEQFAVVGSTNDVVRDWLAAGTPEVCLAVADEQTAGRGREGRTWQAPAGHALLLSLGFRPTWLPPERVWRLAAIVSVAMAEAGEFIAGTAPGSIHLKWPNDLVFDDLGAIRKLAGVLGETAGLGTPEGWAVVGMGINADWPADEFPSDLADAMTSLAAIGGRRIYEDELLEAFLASLEPRFDALRLGVFDAREWEARQIATGLDIELIGSDGVGSTSSAVGVDPETGALIIEAASGGRRSVLVGDIRHIRLPDATGTRRAGV